MPSRSSASSSSSSSSAGRFPSNPLALPTCKLFLPLRGFFFGVMLEIMSFSVAVLLSLSALSASLSRMLRPSSLSASSRRSLLISSSMTRGSANVTPRAPVFPRAEPGTKLSAASPMDPRLSSSSATFGDPSPALSAPRPESRRFCGVKTTWGVDAPVDGFTWKSFRALLCTDLGVEPDAGATGLFGDGPRWGVFLEGGVFRGLDCTCDCGVPAFKGLDDFAGESSRAADRVRRGLADGARLVLRRSPLPRKADRPGLAASDGAAPPMASESRRLEAEFKIGALSDLFTSSSMKCFAFVRSRAGDGSLMIPPIAVVISMPIVASASSPFSSSAEMMRPMPVVMSIVASSSAAARVRRRGTADFLRPL